MSLTEFEPAFPASERPQTQALYRAYNWDRHADCYVQKKTEESNQYPHILLFVIHFNTILPFMQWYQTVLLLNLLKDLLSVTACMELNFTKAIFYFRIKIFQPNTQPSCAMISGRVWCIKIC